MNTRLIIDGIMRQTTVLIAQLSTAAGIRAPLAHIADQIFLDLAREIEAQGVGRKVVADMFGLALRSYQKKMHRLLESQSSRDQTLWEAELEFLSKGSATRLELLERFKYDNEREVVGVLNDLVNSGLVYCTGKGADLLYGLTSQADRRLLFRRNDVQALYYAVWMKVFQKDATRRQELVDQLSSDPSIVDEAIALLVAEGRLEETDGGELVAVNLVVPVGTDQGWEVAVLDHFGAVAKAIATKVGLGQERSETDDRVGGTTLSFSVEPGHPHEHEVYALLKTVREQAHALWNRVAEYNQAHPPAPERRVKVTFYLGQNVERPEGDEIR